jgi:hypothetical protein
MGTFGVEEALNKWIPFMSFDKLTTNGFNLLLFILSPSTMLRTGLSKNLIRAS